ncbi:hypothetical protein C8J56DRAFT_786479 [Mycena floridula]|nr:hypothetical protein C8J56DRAFT_786479 [Mycena floridula]
MLSCLSTLKNASFEKDSFTKNELQSFLDPPTEVLYISDPDRPYPNWAGASESVYKCAYDVNKRRYPDGKMLSYDQVCRRVKKLVRILSFQHNMCISSCMVYTGPFRKLEECMYCKEHCYKPITDLESGSDSDSPESNRQAQIPHKTFTTMPIGPQLQAL